MPVRPAKVTFDSGTEGWDAAVRDNTDIVLDGPLPLFRAADLATLTADYLADEYEQCFALAQDTGVLYMSDGVDWNRVVPIMPHDASPTATTLRDALITAGLMEAPLIP